MDIDKHGCKNVAGEALHSPGFEGQRRLARDQWRADVKEQMGRGVDWDRASRLREGTSRDQAATDSHFLVQSAWSQALRSFLLPSLPFISDTSLTSFATLNIRCSIVSAREDGESTKEG